MPLALTWAIVAGCAAITDAELAERMDRDGDGDDATQWGGTDCDDDDPNRSEEAVETCNGIDDDCKGGADDVQAPEGETFYLDLDHDDVGGEAVQACTQPMDTVQTGGDCDDDDALVHPGVAELCNGIDDDCDGLVDFDDDLDTPTWYGDADGDGYGLDTVVKIVPGCEPPKGYTAAAGDCDDLDPAVNPDGREVCNGYDDDCDQLVDDADSSVDGNLYYPDRDNDGFGSATDPPVVACSEPFGHEPTATDCDDSNAAVNPDAIEVCNGWDDNCVDDEDDAIDRTLWFIDTDGDGYGAETSVPVESCDPPGKGYAATGDDCDDGDVAYHPYADECGKKLDYNCDDSVGEVDNDEDGYDAGCDDCNDANPDINPGATEMCAAGDENCNGLEGDDDEFTKATDKTDWYPDTDADHYGDESATAVAMCVAPPDTVTDHTDCDDGEYAIHPFAADDWYDGTDANCDGKNDWDADGDGYDTDEYTAVHPGDDCDDGDDAINPDAGETILNAIDENCNGSLLY